MLPPDSVSALRAAKQPCEVCQTYEPDESGRCPLCAPGSSGRSGDVIDDLMAHRDRGRSREPHDGAA